LRRRSTDDEREHRPDLVECVIRAEALVAEYATAYGEAIARARFADDEGVRAEDCFSRAERVEELGVVTVEGDGRVEVVVGRLRPGARCQQHAAGKDRGPKHSATILAE
jgi:hypothetical protein